ncbi:YitT family protein [Clostridium sp. JN-9]|uniref:YitT family protein n=1 Tax=Clostridium sp. JN-9 TaxID=2507159 RepID=UPI000FFE2D61|nr:YitT family protein [Clostridium sp. JN-9]QAT41694.1 YitT family protein [Clostridium sp. JN-9]
MKYYKNVLFIILGSFISAIGINVFIVNANLLSGGVSGISLILQYLLKIPAGYTVLIINIPLLFVSYFKINKRFSFLTLVGTLSISLFLIITSPLKQYIHLNDTLLLCLYGGIINGIGLGIVFSNHGSTGGLDIVSALIKLKREDFNIGTISFAFNLIIVAVGAVFFGLAVALYTLVSMYMTSFVMDKVINGLNRRKMILIITSKESEVSKALMDKLKRGVTFLYGEGAYTGHNKKILYCVVSLAQLPSLKQIVREIDEKSFISILDVSEVEGKGFYSSLF